MAPTLPCWWALLSNGFACGTLIFLVNDCLLIFHWHLAVSSDPWQLWSCKSQCDNGWLDKGRSAATSCYKDFESCICHQCISSGFLFNLKILSVPSIVHGSIVPHTFCFRIWQNNLLKCLLWWAFISVSFCYFLCFMGKERNEVKQ